MHWLSDSRREDAILRIDLSNPEVRAGAQLHDMRKLRRNEPMRETRQDRGEQPGSAEKSARIAGFLVELCLG